MNPQTHLTCYVCLCDTAFYCPSTRRERSGSPSRQALNRSPFPHTAHHSRQFRLPNEHIKRSVMSYLHRIFPCRWFGGSPTENRTRDVKIREEEEEIQHTNSTTVVGVFRSTFIRHNGVINSLVKGLILWQNPSKVMRFTAGSVGSKSVCSRVLCPPGAVVGAEWLALWHSVLVV